MDSTHYLSKYQKRMFHADNGMDMPYRFFAPEKVEANIPLVVWLHGISGRGNDNEEQISPPNDVGPAALVSSEVQNKYPAYVLAPQCPTLSMWFNPLNMGSTAALRQVPELIKYISSNFSVDKSRVYLIGQSMGAFGTWSLLARYPEMFAAAVAMSGGGRTRHAEVLSKTPIWAFHGQHDLTVFVYFSRRMIQAIKEVGGKPRYTEYESAPHYIWDKVFDEPELFPWLFSHKKDK